MKTTCTSTTQRRYIIERRYTSSCDPNTSRDMGKTNCSHHDHTMKPSPACRAPTKQNHNGCKCCTRTPHTAVNADTREDTPLCSRRSKKQTTTCGHVSAPMGGEGKKTNERQPQRTRPILRVTHQTCAGVAEKKLHCPPIIPSRTHLQGGTRNPTTFDKTNAKKHQGDAK